MSLDGFEYVNKPVTATSNQQHSKVQNAGFTRALVVIDVSALDTASADETYTFALEGWDPISDTWYEIASTGDIAGDGVGLQRLRVGPSFTETANEKISDFLPEYIRVTLTVGGTTPSITYTVRLELS